MSFAVRALTSMPDSFTKETKFVQMTHKKQWLCVSMILSVVHVAMLDMAPSIQLDKNIHCRVMKISKNAYFLPFQITQSWCAEGLNKKKKQCWLYVPYFFCTLMVLEIRAHGLWQWQYVHASVCVYMCVSAMWEAAFHFEQAGSELWPGLLLTSCCTPGYGPTATLP